MAYPVADQQLRQVAYDQADSAHRIQPAAGVLSGKFCIVHIPVPHGASTAAALPAAGSININM
jgi:hypothetical protein